MAFESTFKAIDNILLRDDALPRADHADLADYFFD